MTVSITPLYPASGTDNPNKQISVTRYNAGSVIAGTAKHVLGFDQDGTAIEVPFATPQMFGAVADCTGVGLGTDNYDAFVAAYAAVSNGGRLFVPKGRYRISQRLEFTRSITVEGEGWTENPGVADGVTFSGVMAFDGSILVFDTDAPGLIFYSFSDGSDANVVATDLAANGAASSYYQYLSARGSSLRNIMLHGGQGTSVTAHGAEVRTVTAFHNVRIDYFGGSGLQIDASGHTNTTPFGIADQSLFTAVKCRFNGLHGIRVRGNDANVIHFNGCDTALNGGCGVLDDGQLGNIYTGHHSATNNQSFGLATTQRTQVEADTAVLADQYAGSYVTSSPIGAHLFNGCYVESGIGLKAHLVTPTKVIGGNLAGDDTLTATSDAFVQGGDGTIWRGKLGHVNQQNAVIVGINIGDTDNGKTVLSFGNSDDAGDVGSYHNWRLRYNIAGADKWWGLDYAGSALATAMQLPQGGSTANVRGGASVYAPAFPNGYFLNGDGFGGDLLYRGYGTAAPSSGAWKQGDMIYSKTPVAGGSLGWICVASGSPGTWKTFGTIAA